MIIVLLMVAGRQRRRTNSPRHELELAIIIELLIVENTAPATSSTSLKSRMVYQFLRTLLEVDTLRNLINRPVAHLVEVEGCGVLFG
jgi:hypothetical protein